MIRETSIAAYHQIRDEGLLSERRWQVYDILVHHGPGTSNELLKHFRVKFGRLYGNSPQMSSRLGELRDVGVAIEKRKRVCVVTGQIVIEWEAVDTIPQPKKPKQKCSHCNGTGVEPTRLTFEDLI